MKPFFILSISLAASLSGMSALGQSYLYVDVNSTNPVPPYANWATAATTIQDAVDAASAGDFVHVASGIYSNGFGANAPVPGNSNRVTIAKAITVQGWDKYTTIIQGAGPLGFEGVRCVYLTNGATLRGFTLRGGTSYSFSLTVGGGGASIEGGARLEDCIVADCEAHYGGGVFIGTNGLVVSSLVASNQAALGGGIYLHGVDAGVQDCLILDNENSSDGGGVFVDGAGWLDACTIEGNVTGRSGGGVCLYKGGALTNCVAQLNRCGHSGGGVHCDQGGFVERCRLFNNVTESMGAGYGGGLALYQGGWGRNCLILGNTAYFQGGGVAVFYSGEVDSCTVCGNHTKSLNDYEGRGGVACIYSGDKVIRNTIIQYNTSVAGPPNWGTYMGAGVFEHCCTTPTNSLPGGEGCFEEDPLFRDAAAGDYRLGANSPCFNTGTNQDWMPDALDLDGYPRIKDGVVDVGAYEYPRIFHVWTNSPSPLTPYHTWSNAAHTIQDAVDAADDGDFVLVTNGVYDTGGHDYAGLTNRVLVEKAIRLESVNGPEQTFIVGQGIGPYGTNNGPGAVRCLCLTHDHAVVCGFTLTNGHTRLETLTNLWCVGGGIQGIRTSPAGATVSNCLVVGCSAAMGGGAFGVSLFNSALKSNRAEAGGGGGAWLCVLEGCELRGNRATTIGGGASLCEVYHCLVISNAVTGAPGEGGGVYTRQPYDLHTSLIIGNAAAIGGGISGGGLHCTVYGNTASQDAGGIFLRDTEPVVVNTIVYANSAPTNANWGFQLDEAESASNFNYCCTYPMPTNGVGHITNEPAFMNLAAGDFRLQYGSPCIDAGTNSSSLPTTDLAGLSRLADGDFDGVATVDIGAYEYSPAAYDTDGDGMADGWEHGYGLDPTNALDAAENPDGDPHTNLDEYLADTDPTNALSYLRIVALSNLPPWTVYFRPSSTNRFYTLESNTNLSAVGWGNIAGQVRVPGTGGTQSLSDTNISGSRFYRVEAQP
jgi:hypothetical protein